MGLVNGTDVSTKGQIETKTANRLGLPRAEEVKSSRQNQQQRPVNTPTFLEKISINETSTSRSRVSRIETFKGASNVMRTLVLRR